MTIPFIKYSRVLLTASALLMVVAFFFLFKWGLKPGIDFTGGSLLETTYSETRPDLEEMQKIFADAGLTETVVQKTDANSYIVRSNFIDEDLHQSILKDIRDKFQTKENVVRESRFETIGPSVSAALKQRAWWAVIFVCLGIIAYVAYAFRAVSRPVASWKYGLLAIVALAHDVMFVVGVFAVLGHFLNIEVDVGFVVALLTVLGYSVNDTIVVYDRIRENLLRHSADNFGEVVNNGLNQTLMRSVNTTIKTLLPLVALFFWGGATIHTFVLALLIGIASGAYSSIFIAAPLLVVVEKWQRR
ncbi:protein translocase subunit SecF [Patescibacteria group bacterium]|nr:protein translocase subunit SecF [Patescibacteria group bacterium]MBU1613411.1 protein translocase subunit SecF [Patescibacteria group bacterium]